MLLDVVNAVYSNKLLVVSHWVILERIDAVADNAMVVLEQLSIVGAVELESPEPVWIVACCSSTAN